MTRVRTKTRVEFVRLTSPDERSLLAFKCWLRETCRSIQTTYLTYAPLSKEKAREIAAAANLSAGPSARSIIRYMDVKNALERQSHERRARVYLQESIPEGLGFSGSTALIEMIATLSANNAALRQMLVNTFGADCAKRQRRRWNDEEWHPSRKTVTETVMGTFVSHSLSPSALADTAHHLSEGLPERDGKREHGVRSDHVDDAIYRFACDNFRFISSASIVSTLANLGREELIADRLWAKVQDACKPRPVTSILVEHLFDEGALLEWAADFEETVSHPTSAQITEAYQTVLTMAIRRLDVEQRKLTGEASPKKSRKTRLVSRCPPSDASAPTKEI